MGEPSNFTPRRAISVDDALWDAYGEAVGDGGRSADVRAYIAWRVDHPDTPLPGTRRPPAKKVRRRAGGEAPGDPTDL